MKSARRMMVPIIHFRDGEGTRQELGGSRRGGLYSLVLMSTSGIPGRQRITPNTQRSEA